MNLALDDLKAVTHTIQDASTKMHLRPVVAESLRSFGHSEEAVQEALNNFFKEPTLQ